MDTRWYTMIYHGPDIKQDFTPSFPLLNGLHLNCIYSSSGKKFKCIYSGCGVPYQYFYLEFLITCLICGIPLPFYAGAVFIILPDSLSLS
jgi:hypothetical protein